jgi:hypothetical protein
MTHLPLYFTKCRRCHRRRPIDADEVAFRLLEAGITDPVQVLQPADRAGPESRGADDDDEAKAQQLVANRQRAYGRKHPLTFEARAQLAEAIGRSGDPDRAAHSYEQLVADQTARGRHPSPSVLSNRYQAAVWTARAGSTSAALAALQAVLADQEALLRPDDANVLVTRASIAQLVADTGDRDDAIEMLRLVVQDQLRVLGSEHPTTEMTRRLLDEWEGRR